MLTQDRGKDYGPKMVWLKILRNTEKCHNNNTVYIQYNNAHTRKIGHGVYIVTIPQQKSTVANLSSLTSQTGWV